MRLDLELLPGRFAACRLAPDAAGPAWVPERGSLVVLARTTSELSIVCDGASSCPTTVRAERGYRAFAVRGPLPFDADRDHGWNHRRAGRRRIPLLAISTFDTDYVLVHEPRLEDCQGAARGRTCRRAPGDAQRSPRTRILPRTMTRRALPRLALLLSLLPTAALADTYPRQAGVDAIHYVFRLTVGDASNEITGECTATLKIMAPGITEIFLDLTSAAQGKA